MRICQFTASMGAESSSFFDRKNRDPTFQTSKGFFQHGHASYVLTVRVGTKKNKRRFCFYDFQTSWSIGIIRVVSCFLIKLAKMTTFNDIIYIYIYNYIYIYIHINRWKLLDSAKTTIYTSAEHVKSLSYHQTGGASLEDVGNHTAGWWYTQPSVITMVIICYYLYTHLLIPSVD